MNSRKGTGRGGPREGKKKKGKDKGLERRARNSLGSPERGRDIPKKGGTLARGHEGPDISGHGVKIRVGRDIRAPDSRKKKESGREGGEGASRLEMRRDKKSSRVNTARNHQREPKES